MDQAVIRSPWAREYARTPKTYIWGTEASSLAHDVSALLPPGARVLDLGCGEGRDSVFFAECGFDVTGVDIARSGLSKAERLAHARRVRVHWICSDIGGLDVSRLRDGVFDLIYSCGAIHYLPRAVRARLFPRLRAVTPESGLHAQIVFTDRSVYVEKGERIDYFAPGELTGLYADWLILAREERLIDCSQDGTIHHHSVEQLIAQAPRRA
jgi:tellurite methyltransferase